MQLAPLVISWSSFVPDLIVGVVTGAVVGAALVIYQVKAAAADRVAEAKAVSRRIVQPLLLALQRPNLDRHYDRLTPLPRKLVRSIEIVEGSDLDHWHDIDPTDLTTRLVRFRSTVWDLREDAHDLEQAVQRWARLHAVEERTAEYAIATLLDAPHQYLREAFPDAAQRSRLAADTALLMPSHHVKLHARKYRKAAARVDRARTKLLEVLIVQVRGEGVASDDRRD